MATAAWDLTKRGKNRFLGADPGVAITTLALGPTQRKRVNLP